MAISLRLHACVQVLKIFFQVLPVLFLRDSIHTYRCILPNAVVSALQSEHID
jgi:hypothetical protein